MRYPLIFLTLFIAACSGSEKEVPETPPVVVDNNPMTADSITPAQLKDTVGLDDYGKDSLRMSIYFQRAANALSQAYLTKDVPTYCKYSAPVLVNAAGGMSAYMQRVREKVFDNNYLTYDRLVTGPAKRIGAAIDDQGYAHGWYCLMPVRRFRHEGGKEIMEVQWLGGQSLDMGKHIYFLDVTGKPREAILQVMPDLRLILDQEATALQ